MVIRCKTCHGSVWVDTDVIAGRTVRATCPGCRQRYELAAPPDASATRKLSNDARRLARDKSIDLPAAYSVLLGVMKLEQVNELTQPGPAPAPAAPAADEMLDDFGPSAYDPAFREAVEAKRLSPKQAAARGRRATYAAFLATRHKLPMPTAFAVTDNRLSLLQALRKQGAMEQQPVHLRVRASHLRRAMWVLLGLLPVAAAAAAALNGRPAHERPIEAVNSRIVAASEIRTDSHGNVVQILGSDPGKVLAAYCLAADPLGRLDLLGIVPAASEGPRARLGIFRRSGGPSAPMAIKILEDRTADRWVAGDGRSLLTATPAPPELAAPLEAAARQRGNARFGPNKDPEVKTP